MAYNLIVRPKAQVETITAADYYDCISSALADRFLVELNNAYKKIIIYPQYYKYVAVKRSNKYRCIHLKGFPFLVIFGIDGWTVVVFAILHTHRKNKYI